MSRWTPNARGRLEQAAYDLFLARGYEHTTVMDIADRAGLTMRTFYRHYADKREVLFGGSITFRDELLRALDEQSPAIDSFEAVRAAVEAMSRLMRGRRVLSRERRQIIDAHTDLQERGLIKRATLTSALALRLKQRGIVEPAATLSAEVGIAVFYVAYDRWLDGPASRELIDVVRDGFEQVEAFAVQANLRRRKTVANTPKSVERAAVPRERKR